MLPVDSQTTNDYINALKEQFGQIRSVVNKSVYFTTRENTADSINNYFPLLEDYKVLLSGFNTPDSGQPLDELVATDSEVFQLYQGDSLFVVTGTGVQNISTGLWAVPSGAEVEVTQNGGQVPSAETFVATGDPVMIYLSDDGGQPNFLLPARGKAYYGHINLPTIEGTFTLALVRPDRTYHVQAISTAGLNAPTNPVFFTHIFSNVDNVEVYFTGKELTFVDADYLVDEYVAPSITYTPD